MATSAEQRCTACSVSLQCLAAGSESHFGLAFECTPDVPYVSSRLPILLPTHRKSPHFQPEPLCHPILAVLNRERCLGPCTSAWFLEGWPTKAGPGKAMASCLQLFWEGVGTKTYLQECCER
jgi:hypothetical protein